jgi:hypothetical protein
MYDIKMFERKMFGVKMKDFINFIIVTDVYPKNKNVLLSWNKKRNKASNVLEIQNCSEIMLLKKTHSNY